MIAINKNNKYEITLKEKWTQENKPYNTTKTDTLDGDKLLEAVGLMICGANVITIKINNSIIVTWANEKKKSKGTIELVIKEVADEREQS